MKSNQLLRIALNAFLPVVVGSMFFLTSCKKDNNVVNKPAPTLSVSTPTASNTAGSAALTTVTVDAPEGGKTLKITVNGVADASLPDVTLNGSTSEDVDINFTIPASATVGAIYTISFQAIDKKNQASLSSTFNVTVSAVPTRT